MSLFYRTKLHKSIPILLFVCALTFAGLFSLAVKNFVIKTPLGTVYLAETAQAACWIDNHQTGYCQAGCSGYSCPYRCDFSGGVNIEKSANNETCGWDIDTIRCDTLAEAQAYCKGPDECQTPDKQVTGSSSPSNGVNIGAKISFTFTSPFNFSNPGINEGGGVTGCIYDGVTGTGPYSWRWTCTAQNQGTYTASFTNDLSCTNNVNYTVNAGTCDITMPSTVPTGTTFNYSVKVTGSSISSRSLTGQCSNLTGCPNGTNSNCAGTINSTASTGFCRLTVNLANGRSCNQTTSVTCQNTTGLITSVAPANAAGVCGTYSSSVNFNIGLSNPPPQLCIKGDLTPNANGIQITKEGEIIDRVPDNTPTIIQTNSVIGSERFRAVFPGNNTYCQRNGNPVDICVSSLPSIPSNPNLYLPEHNLNLPPVDSPTLIKSADTTATIVASDAPKIITQFIGLGSKDNRLLLVGLSYLGDGATQPSATVRLKTEDLSTTLGTFTLVPGSKAVYLQNGSGIRYSEIHYLRVPAGVNNRQAIEARFGGATSPAPRQTIMGVSLLNRVDTTSALFRPNPSTGNAGYAVTGSKTTTNDSPLFASRKTSITLTTDPTDLAFAVNTAQTPPSPTGNKCGPHLVDSALLFLNGSPATGSAQWDSSAANGSNVCQVNGQAIALKGVKGTQTIFTWLYPRGNNNNYFPDGVNLRWATSGVVVKGQAGVPGKLEWEVSNWGTICGGTTTQSSRIYYWPKSQGALRPATATLINVSGATTSYTFSPLSSIPPYGQYYWQVEASNNNFANKVVSPVWQFAVVEPDFKLNTTTEFYSGITSCTSGTHNAILVTAQPKNIGNWPGISNLHIKGNRLSTGNDAADLTTCQSLADLTGASSWLNANQTLSPALTYSTSCPSTPGTYYFCGLVNPQTASPVERATANNYSYLLKVTSQRNAYFQTLGGGTLSLGATNSRLPISEYLSKKTTPTSLDAGIISALTTPSAGSGNYSQNGGGTTPTGWFRTGVASIPRPDELLYVNLHKAVLTNAGVDPDTATTNCGALGYFDSGSYRIFCYANGAELNAAIASSLPAGITTAVAIPTTIISPTIGPLTTGQTNKRMVVFVNTNIAISAGGIAIDPANNSAGIVFVVNGNIDATAANRVDGVFIFSGQFITGSSNTNQLTGQGSLIGTGTNPFSFTRTFGTTGTANPAELWTYQPKYLWLFRNILVRPSYSWKELTPQ